MDNVNNRSLFRNRSGAAREKVRQMGRVQEPQGILSAFPELMRVAAPQQPMMQPQQPMMQPQQMPQRPMMPQQMPMPAAMQQPMMQPQQPARFQEGGPVEPSLAERFGQNTMSSLEMVGDIFNPAKRQSQPAQGFDIAATPTPRARVEVPDIATMVKQNIGDNPEAQKKFAQLEGALTDPEADAEARKAAITDAAGVENTKDGLRSVVSQITGREQPASATVDELNNAISGVALGGAIGGPRSVAARISEALLVGLQAKRETAMGRERFGQELAVAGAKAKPDTPKGFLETPRGEAALEQYNEFLGQELLPDQAYARLNAVSPGLGSELEAAMAGQSAPAAAPARSPEETQQILEMARDALAQERDRGAVENMLRDMGVDPAAL